MQPLFNKIFIIPIIDEQKTAGGLSTTVTQFKKGKVQYPGTGLPDRPMSVKQGDIILYRNDGTPYNHEGTELILLREEDIDAIISI